MRIAIIGAGVAGLSAALALSGRRDIVLYEKAARLGGHANTLTVDYDGAAIAVDTGFMVFNEHNYPLLTGMLAHLCVGTIATDMSFSVSGGRAGYEWSSDGLSGLFAWKRNLARPEFLCMLGDIVRFSAQARADLHRSRVRNATLADYVSRLNLSDGFVRHYLAPMGAAIWSSSEGQILRFPAESFLRFCDNHRLLHLRRPEWRTVTGGSQVYVDAIGERLGASVRTRADVAYIERVGERWEVRERDGPSDRFDQVVLACHADEAAALLDPTFAAQRAALSDIRFAANTVYLHRDTRLMPRRRAAWASWNYLSGQGDGAGACVSYWMNRLQAIDETRPLFVTLNPAAPPAAELRLAQMTYAHPQFDADAIAAQARLGAMQGRDGLWFAGAWLGYGFHEDGLRAGLAAAERLGGHAPWRDQGADAPLPAAA
jgi:predicted NAD/FAD-binding protein